MSSWEFERYTVLFNKGIGSDYFNIDDRAIHKSFAEMSFQPGMWEKFCYDVKRAAFDMFASVIATHAASFLQKEAQELIRNKQKKRARVVTRDAT